MTEHKNPEDGMGIPWPGQLIRKPEVPGMIIMPVKRPPIMPLDQFVRMVKRHLLPGGEALICEARIVIESEGARYTIEIE